MNNSRLHGCQDRYFLHPVASLLVVGIRFYQRFVSPLCGLSCRFYPSCSEYSRQGILRFGALRGLYLSARRIVRCHPFCNGGMDPVPERFSITLVACPPGDSIMAEHVQPGRPASDLREILPPAGTFTGAPSPGGGDCGGAPPARCPGF